MTATTRTHADGRLTYDLGDDAPTPSPTPGGSGDLVGRYRAIRAGARLSWAEHHLMLRRLGAGGQGVVFLAHRLGADGFRLPVALKVFSPERYADPSAYEAAMARMARVASRVALIQQDNLVDVHNFAEQGGLRVMEMEWVDGYDLARLLTAELYDRARERVDDARWAYLNDVVVTAGPSGPRLKAGIAIAVLRDALAALSALHRGGVVHGDVKPSNLMLKRTGDAKLIDVGSAFEPGEPAGRTFTPGYAAPEVIRGEEATARSDLASLGYVLVEALSGAPLFAGLADASAQLEARASLPGRLAAILPAEVSRNELLMDLISGLVAHEPSRRFPDAEAADLVERGAASFQRQLVRGDLAVEYDAEIRSWLEALD